MTSQKVNLQNYGICRDNLKVLDEECVLTKNQHLIAIWG